MSFVMLPNGCSWYETNRLGGCQRLAHPRPECAAAQQPQQSSSHRLALLVPYRGASAQLDVAELCDRLSVHLRRHDIEYHIFVANQIDRRPFNRGALVNAAVATLLTAEQQAGPSPSKRFDYLAVHDIDRFPVVANASCARAKARYYAFPEPRPRVLHPTSFAGGVLVASVALFRAVNGFSNSYWGWGEEDNDLFVRLRWCGLPPVHGEELDACMEHRDCAACKTHKRLLNASVLRGHERRMRHRLEHPRRHMLRDGLSTLNFTVRRSVRRARCGRLGTRMSVIDVDLSAHDAARAGTQRIY